MASARIPRGAGRPDAVTFEPEKWTKSTWKGETAHTYSPPKKAPSLVDGLKGLLPKKKVGRIKHWGSQEWKPLREGDVETPSDKVEKGRWMTGGEPPPSQHRRPNLPLTSREQFKFGKK